jgi:acyl-CoA thioesterase-2
VTASDHPHASLAEDILRLEQTGPTSFRSEHRHDNSTGTIFGGQFLAQALLAAQRTAPHRPANSCGAYFLRPGGFEAPVDYEVEAVRDGRTFANRRVVARQGGKALFDMLCSFRAPGEGHGHQAVDCGGLPGPEDLPDLQDFLRANEDRIPPQEVTSYLQPLPVQFRLIEPERSFHLAGKPAARRDFWMRFPAAEAIEDIREHQPLIAFVSDFWIGPVANELRSPPFPKRVPVLTVSHSIAFQGPARADDWLLYRVESPFAAEGLGFTRGLLFNRQGRLVASTTQEVLML